MGEMKRAIAWENEERQRDHFASTLVIASAIIAAVRLARDDISRPSPRLFAVVADSVSLATMMPNQKSPGCSKRIGTGFLRYPTSCVRNES
jgi:hypothetical protein